MNVLDLISVDFPKLTLEDVVANALNLMDEYRVSHLPVLNGERYIGLVSEEELELMEFPNKSLTDQHKEFVGIHINAEQHIFDAVKLFSRHDLTLLPIVDNNNRYLGCITIDQMVDNIAKIQSVNEPGAIIVLVMNSRDYSMQQIAGIVESNSSKILSSSITSPTDSMLMEVTLKVNTENIGPIIQTFERFDYQIKASYKEHSSVTEDLKDRYDEFMNYLNI